MMYTRDIRKLFLEYFKNKGHVIVPSSSLVPVDDPSLLFTSAGMVQFKKIFLGQEIVDFKRATSCQRCLRAGGKHNDLENVGFTSRHHTFFEMLGNFSFGDYFKREAIFFAWDFVTKYLKLPAEKLWITVFKDDLESENIWLQEIKISPNRISRCDENENFWAMGDTGPCGPCSEIYYDHGANFIGDPPGLGDPGDRYVEIYNLVFMQYNRTETGELHNLPKPCVDTGMGLERVAAIMQGVNSNYDIDIFTKLIKEIAILLDINDLKNNSLKVIADHLRACSFLITDGIVPSNEGRGYVLRRIMRRAIRHGYKLGRSQPFFYLLVKNLVNIMGEDFPELVTHQSKIEKLFLLEEEQFANTLEYGMSLLQQEIKQVSDNILPGNVIFKLYDTYGFPVDLINDVVKEYNMTLDLATFEAIMLQQRTRAKQVNKFHDIDNIDVSDIAATKFIGYQQVDGRAKILKIFDYNSNKAISNLQFGKMAKIFLDNTPFYAESGGQVGDTGYIYNLLDNNAKFTVIDTKKIGNSHIVHIGKLETGLLQLGDTVIVQINDNRRQKIRLNHSATHLLHAALREILGTHVKQKGSVVDDQRLRFDFEHFQPLTAIEISAIQRLVNQQIRKNSATVTEVMSIKDAVAKGAVALFEEKYQDEVRVLNIADNFSVELCGGTHVDSSGDIGCFVIINEEAISSGTRRIEAITGESAIEYILALQSVSQDLLQLFKIADLRLIKPKIDQVLQNNKDLEKDLDIAQKNNINMQAEILKMQAKEVTPGIKLLVTEVNINPKYLKLITDKLKQSLGTAVIILGCIYNNKATILVGVTKDIINKISAAELIKYITTYVGGKGGGRSDLAEGSGSNVTNLNKALDAGCNKAIEILNFR